MRMLLIFVAVKHNETTMIKQYFSLSLLLILMLSHSLIKAQEINQMMMDTLRKRPVLIDFVDRDGLQTGEFAESYATEYADYQVDQSIADQLKTVMTGVEVTIVLGSWCGDSKEQLPRFLRLMDAIGFPEDNLVMIAVGSDKKARTIDAGIYAVQKVPTFIFYRMGKELGRIIETPRVSLEADMLRILKRPAHPDDLD